MSEQLINLGAKNCRHRLTLLKNCSHDSTVCETNHTINQEDTTGHNLGINALDPRYNASLYYADLVKIYASKI